MLNQFNIKTIIMLTGLMENGKSKCSDYTNNALEKNKNDGGIWKSSFNLTGDEPNFNLVQKEEPQPYLTQEDLS